MKSIYLTGKPPPPVEQQQNLSLLPRKITMAVCMVTGDLFHLQRQIAFLSGLSYSDFQILAAVNGIPESVFCRMAPQYKELIDSGKLILRHFAPKNPLADFLNASREIDNVYDLYVKWDENLLLWPDILEHIKGFHLGIQEGRAGYWKGRYWRQGNKEGVYFMESRPAHYPLLYSLTPDLINSLKEMERNGTTDLIGSLNILLEKEKAGNMAGYLDSMGRQLIRGGMNGNSQIPLLAGKHACVEHILEIAHRSWYDWIRISGTSVRRLNVNDTGYVLRYDGHELWIKWDQWGVERFTRNDQGMFRYAEITSGMAISGARKEEDEMNFSAKTGSWGVCTVAIPRESFYWLRDWIEFHFRAGASLIVIYDNTGSEGSCRDLTAFRNGHLQRSQVSKRGEEYGRLTAHLSDEDIQAHLYELVRRYGAERLRIIPWKPLDPETGRIVHGQTEAYDEFISNYKDEVEWAAFIDLDEYLYCRPGITVKDVLDQMNREKPGTGILRLKQWQFQRRWGDEGPNDIRRYRKHKPTGNGGEKNIARLRDVLKADIHWYWNMRPGIKNITAHPNDIAFCHYNARPEEIENGTEFIKPRAFLSPFPAENKSIVFL